MALVNSFDSVIFDFGGVLVEHQTEADHRRMAELAGIPSARFSELYWKHRAEYDRGTVTAADYWSHLAEAGAHLDDGMIERLIQIDAQSWMRFDEPMWNWIARLRSEDKRVAMLSNMPLDLGKALQKTTRLEAFDHVTLSYELHSCKPEPAIYQHCLKGLGSSPEGTIFFDDRMENIEGAGVLGIRGFLFTNHDDALSRIG